MPNLEPSGSASERISSPKSRSAALSGSKNADFPRFFGAISPVRGTGCVRVPEDKPLLPFGGLMNRRELVLALSERMEVDRKTADAALTAVVEEITAQVSKGVTVSI